MAQDRFHLASKLFPYGKDEDGNTLAVIAKLNFVRNTWELCAYKLTICGDFERTALFSNGYTVRALFSTSRYSEKSYKTARRMFDEEADDFVKASFDELK